MESGIYKIYNKQTHQYYIGQSVNVKNRLNTHRQELRKGKHINKKLQSAFNEYGEDNFIFKKIHDCEEEFLNAMERYFMEKYEALTVGYNKTPMNNLVRDDIRRKQANEKLLYEFENLNSIDLEVDEITYNNFKLTTDLSKVFEKYATDDEDEINSLGIPSRTAEVVVNMERYFFKEIQKDLEESIFKQAIDRIKEKIGAIENLHIATFTYIDTDYRMPVIKCWYEVNIHDRTNDLKIITEEFKHKEIMVNLIKNNSQLKGVI